MLASTENFSENYRLCADGELLQLALHREQLVAAASAALDAELAARGLGEDALREFQEQSRAEANAAAADPQDELPPPQELPPDWFDDTSDPAADSLATSRPKGVTAAAYLFWAGGVINMAFSGTLTVSALTDRSLLWLTVGSSSSVVGLFSLSQRLDCGA